jgi:hypothetical protein
VRRALALVAVGLALGACRRHRPESPTTTVAARPVGAAADRTAAAAAFVDRWVAAQNAGDFAAYSDLYARSFHGVRRSGGHSARFDRRGWLADRARLFRKPVRVAVADIAIHDGGRASGVEVGFTQTFTSGSYRDVGPKRLLLVDEEGALRIAAEEMLSATRVPVASAGDVAYRHVIEEGVIASGAPDESWGVGPFRVDQPVDDRYRVHRAIDASRLPPDVARLAGARLRLFNAHGPVCEATVTGFELLGRLSSEWGVTGADDQALEGEALARAVWDQTPEGRLLVGALHVESGDCADATWARDAALPVPSLLPIEEAPPAWAALARDAARQLPDWRKLQAEYERFRAERAAEMDGGAFPDRWDEYLDEPAQARVLMFTHEGRRYLSVAFEANGGCNDFDGALWVLYAVAGTEPATARLRLRGGPLSSAIAPLGAVDLDGDGRPEILVPGGVVRWSGDRLREVDIEETPWRGCPC